MPNRSESHQLEARSLIALQSRLPAYWVFREEHPDYGIDGSIEVFAADGSPTGLRCLVQIKSTATGSDRPRVRLRVDTAKYYEALDLPVLVVLYEAGRDCVWARWFHEFDPYYGGRGENWITFPFQLQHKWNEGTTEHLEKDLQTWRVLRRGALPLPIPLKIIMESSTFGGMTSAEAVAAIRRRLRKYRSIFVEHDDESMWIRADEEKTVISFRGNHSVTLHLAGEDVTTEEYSAEVILILALAIASAGDHNLAATLTTSVAGESRLMQDPDVFSRVAESMARSQQVGLALELSEQLLRDTSTRPAAEFLMITALLPRFSNDRSTATVERYLRSRIEYEKTGKSPANLGAAYYNLGNHLRGRGRFREALRHYRKAAEILPAYKERDYYIKEITVVRLRR